MNEKTDYSKLSDEELISLKRKLEKSISIADTNQLAIKIAINSLYGACGESNFIFFDIRLATSITCGGRLAIQWVSNYVNKKLNDLLKTNKDYVIYNDTDSVYFGLADFVNKSPVKDSSKKDKIDFLCNFSKSVISKFINEAFDELAKRTNSTNCMSMKLEIIGDTGIWMKKKKYVISVWDQEGVRYDKPKKKVTGLEIVKSSTPKIVKEELTNMLDIVLYGEESQLQERVLNFKNKFSEFPVEEIAIPTGVNGVSQYMSGSSNPLYIQGTPINSRAAILYNQCLKDFKVDHKYEKISEGSKIRYLYLNKRNHIKENVIGFVSVLPPEFNLHRYVDKDLMFEKAFKNMVDILIEPLGWNAIQQNSLEDFF